LYVEPRCTSSRHRDRSWSSESAIITEERSRVPSHRASTFKDVQVSEGDVESRDYVMGCSRSKPYRVPRKHQPWRLLRSLMVGWMVDPPSWTKRGNKSASDVKDWRVTDYRWWVTEFDKVKQNREITWATEILVAEVSPDLVRTSLPWLRHPHPFLVCSYCACWFFCFLLSFCFKL
jgi:hypothetical protein